mmetsp:Transcript_2873/g.6649  ORF Transcript_2873/g.6649 Transcript_2873/m.6649 type:complete len:268 (+) Transcript_2873:397-1200(+)
MKRLFRRKGFVIVSYCELRICSRRRCCSRRPVRGTGNIKVKVGIRTGPALLPPDFVPLASLDHMLHVFDEIPKGNVVTQLSSNSLPGTVSLSPFLRGEDEYVCYGEEEHFQTNYKVLCPSGPVHRIIHAVNELGNNMYYHTLPERHKYHPLDAQELGERIAPRQKVPRGMVERHQTRQCQKDRYVLQDNENKLRTLVRPLRPQHLVADCHPYRRHGSREYVYHGTELTLVQYGIGQSVGVAIVLASVEEGTAPAKVNGGHQMVRPRR